MVSGLTYFFRGNQKIKAQKKCYKLSGLSGFSRYFLERGNSKYSLQESINSINMSTSKLNCNPLGELSFFNQSYTYCSGYTNNSQFLSLWILLPYLPISTTQIIGKVYGVHLGVGDEFGRVGVGDGGVMQLIIFQYFLQLIKYMIQNKLESQWGIWFIYQGESYEGNVHLITTVSTVADFAYFWTQSPIASLSQFFLKDDYKQKSYQIEGSGKKINSIEFFRKGIEPKWEDEQNQKGGRFIFQVPKAQPNKKEIYEHFTFKFIGEDFDRSEKVNGFRFISSKNPQSFSYRIELWVNFDESDFESIEHFQNLFNELFKSLNFEVKEISFKQMKGEGVKKADPKEGKGQGKGEGKGDGK